MRHRAGGRRAVGRRASGAAPSGVGTSGTSLTLNGSQWWPVGVNAYQLGTDWSVNAGCGAQVDLDGYFGALPPHTLSRVDVYSSMAVNKNTGQLDFSALDAVFDAAARHGQLLVAVLSGHDGACENERAKSRAWYAGGWRDTDPHGSPGAVPFATWLDTAVDAVGELPGAGRLDRRRGTRAVQLRVDGLRVAQPYLPGRLRRRVAVLLRRHRRADPGARSRCGHLERVGRRRPVRIGGQRLCDGRRLPRRRRPGVSRLLARPRTRR